MPKIRKVDQRERMFGAIADLVNELRGAVAFHMVQYRAMVIDARWKEKGTPEQVKKNRDAQRP